MTARIRRPAFLAAGPIVLAAAVALAVPRQAVAQDPCIVCEPGGGDAPPAVWITPSTGSYSGSGTTYQLAVTIEWCDDYNLLASSRMIRLNGQNVTGNFSFTLGSDPSCGAYATSTGTVTLPSGTNTLTAEIGDYFGNTGSGSESYSYSQVIYSVVVTPDGGTVTRTASGSYSETFTVQNTGNQTSIYSFTQLCTGIGVASCSTPGAVTLGPGTTTNVAVGYSTNSGGSTGEVRLRASANGAQDEGWITVTVNTPPPPGPPAAPQVTVSPVNSASAVERDLCLTIGIGSDAAYECGDLRLVHTLSMTRTLNKARAPALMYNSQHAHPYPLIAAHVGLPAGSGLPDSVVATITINGAERARKKWAGSGWSAGATRRITLGFDGLTDPTNVYAYTLRVANWYGSTEYPATGVSDEVIIINRSTGVFGAGWWLAGLEQLYFLGGSMMLWVGGDGSARKYVSVSSNVWAGPALDRPDTLKWDPTISRYVRYLRNGLKVRFSSTGEHRETVNRLGHITSFSHDCARLTSILLPPGSAGKTYTFSYTDACGQGQPRLQFIDAPPNGSVTRRVTVTTNANGQVTSIKDASGDSVRFEPDPSVTHRLRARVDRRGTATNYRFDAGSRLSESSLDMGPGEAAIAATFQSAETKGLPASAFPEAVDTAEVYTLVDGPRATADVVDHSRFWLDRFGAPRIVRDAGNAETVLTRGDLRWPGLVTEVKSPTNVVTQAWYNAQGLLDSTKTLSPYGDGRNAVTRYRWDSMWQSVTAIVPPEQDSVVYDYDPANGNRRWQQDARGAAARVAFGYYASGVEIGLLASIDGPLSPPEQIYYDPLLGNLRESRSALGFRTRYHSDALGRDTLIVTPFDASQQDSVRQRAEYDKMDRVLLSQTIAPFRPNHANIEIGSARTTFDPEGNPLTVERWATPNPANINTLTNTYTYDRANRQKARWVSGPTPSADSVAYDPAGNVVTSYTRRGHVITMQYDALGRLLNRNVPAEVLPERIFVGRSFPFYSDGLTIPSETVRYTYDVLGNMTSARNRDARIRRAYYPNGALKTDTLVTLTWTRTDSTKHVYGLRYEYDLNGRRKTLWHPEQLVPHYWGYLPNRDVQYTYHDFGLLKSVTHDVSQEIWYDLQSRIDSVARPGVFEKRIYDGDGRLVRRVEKGVGYQGYNRYNIVTDTIHDDAYAYDGRGKVTTMLAMRDSIAYLYNGLGHVAETFANQPWDPNSTEYLREYFGTDALGNRHSDRTDASGLAVDKYSRYEGTTARLTRSFAVGTADGDTSTYDAAGNLVTLHRVLPKSTYSQGEYYAEEFVVNFYDPEGRLRIADRRTSVDGHPWFWPREMGGFEEYRYDPLGRRILTRVQRDSAGLPDNGIIERYVWDQDQLLYEIRYPGGGRQPLDSLERDTSTVADSVCLSYCAGDPEAMTWMWRYYPHYGRVMYLHGLGIDQPLSIFRAGYGKDSTLFQPFKIYPHTDARGGYDLGTYGSGSDRHFQNFVRAEIEWPAPNVQTFYQFKPPTPEPVSWTGGLIAQQRTMGGNLYMRNRYYDPVSGRFTQEDPIGLAGGLNVYGFANGDPVNFSDPFGLFAVDDIYFSMQGQETRRVDNDKPDRYFLETGERTIQIDQPLSTKRPVSGVVDDPGAINQVATSLVAAAPRYTSMGEFRTNSHTGESLDFKQQLHGNILWNAGNGMYWSNDKVGNVAWAYYAKSTMGYPLIVALLGAQYQARTRTGRGDDPLDQAAIRRGYGIP